MTAATRRDLMGAGLFTALAGVAAAAVATPDPVSAQSAPILHPDAELIALCRQFDDLERQVIALYEGPTRIADDDARMVAIEPIEQRQAGLLDRITVTRTKTLDGIRAKARTLDLFELDRGTSETEGYHNERLMASIMRDLVGEGAHG